MNTNYNNNNLNINQGFQMNNQQNINSQNYQMNNQQMLLNFESLNTMNSVTIYDCFDYQRREINITSLFDEVNLSTLDEFGINKNTGMAFCDKCQTETKCSLYNYLFSRPQTYNL